MTSTVHFFRVLWRFIRPELEESIIYGLAIVGLGLIAFYQSVLQVSGEAENYTEAFSLIGEMFTFITSGDDIAAYIFTFGTWFIIGTIVYMLAWFLVSFWSGAFHDIQVSNSYVHPRSFKKSDYWFAVVARVILRVSAAISLLLYSSLWIATLAPSWLASFKRGFASGFSSEAALSLTVAAVGVALSLHLAALLLRVVLLRSKYFYQK